MVIAARGGDLAGLFVLNGTQAPVNAVLPLLESPHDDAAALPPREATFRLVLATDPQLDELTGNRWHTGDTVGVPAQSVAMFAVT